MTSVIKAKIVSVRHEASLTAVGGCRIDYPNGFDANDTLIIQPCYRADGIVGWVPMVQLQDGWVNIYVRQGTTAPQVGTRVSFFAIFIKH